MVVIGVDVVVDVPQGVEMMDARLDTSTTCLAIQTIFRLPNSLCDGHVVSCKAEAFYMAPI